MFWACPFDSAQGDKTLVMLSEVEARGENDTNM